MRLQDLIHPPNRHSWTVRLIIYIAVVVTLGLVVQLVNVLLFV